MEFDRNNIATLEGVFRANGLADKITLVQGDVCKVDLPEKVDVIIGEMIATALLEELQVPAMNNMLRFAKRRTRVLLNRYRSFVDLVHNPATYYGFDFPLVRYEYSGMPELKSKAFSNKHLISDVNFAKPVTDLKVDQHLALEVQKQGRLNGLRFSSETIFWDGSTLGAAYAYSYPLILPIEPRDVRKGEILSVRIRYTLCGGMKTLRYSVE
ncbi:MAG: hypothetical protein Q8O52_27230 [Sulfuritalea sp.]|nr:hypothetical protein [Sulfuritalea sp.]